jgi:hypothetical protein
MGWSRNGLPPFLVARERPDLLDLAVRGDPVEVEAVHREDVECGAVRVPEDLSRLGRLAEEVSTALPGREAAAETPLTNARTPGEEAGGDGNEDEEDLSPERQHPKSV